MTSMNRPYARCYYLRGGGDCAAATAIQARLLEHGLCSYFTWDPRPPRWRFFYESDLSRQQIESTLGTLRERFTVEVTE
jgi:hypothetical protein